MICRSSVIIPGSHPSSRHLSKGVHVGEAGLVFYFFTLSPETLLSSSELSGLLYFFKFVVKR